MRWLLGFDTVLSASVVEVGYVDIGCVGSVAMRCVPGFDFVVSGSVSSVDSVQWDDWRLLVLHWRVLCQVLDHVIVK